MGSGGDRTMAASSEAPAAALAALDAETEFDAAKGLVYNKSKRSKYMTEKDLSELPLLQRINWLSTTIIFFPAIAFCVGCAFVPLRKPTFYLFLVQYILTGLGITGGYHRLWSHTSYAASLPVELVLLAWGAAAFEGSARWWCRNHRAHHRYVDTKGDPYRIDKGFLYAHVGWMVLKQDTRQVGRVDITDLNKHKLIMLQHKYYLPIALFFGFVLPVAIGTLGWGDFWGSLVYAGFGRMFFVHQATFCVNSLAHAIGEQTYSKEHTSYDSVITALVTFGEGYHNAHHEFPHDYRNGFRWYHYDPTKWVIRFLAFFGLCSNLIAFPENEIEKAKIQIIQADLDERKKAVDWGVPEEELPEMTWDEMRSRHDAGEALVAVNGFVHKVDDFMDKHPGGRKILQFWVGRDATLAFNGEVYRHSKAARNLLVHFRIAVLKEKLE